MATPIGEFIDQPERPTSTERPARVKKMGRTSGRLLDLKAAEVYSGISAWTLRDLIASGDLPPFGRRDSGASGSIERTGPSDRRLERARRRLRARAGSVSVCIRPR